MLLTLKSLANAKPEVRFFALLWMKAFYQQSKAMGTVADTATQLGVSKDVVSASLKYLVDHDFLKKGHKELRSRVGRPSLFYTASEKLLVTLTDGVNSHIPNIDLIDEVLKKRGKDSAHSELKLGNRLLLIVFLLHADQFGLVQELGFTAISQLTGMSRDQFNSQLEKLSRLGYIKQITTGVTSKHLFGSKASIYWVNVTREQFRRASFDLLTCEDAWWDEGVFIDLIKRSKDALQLISNLQRSGDRAREVQRLSLKRKIDNFSHYVHVQNAERCWRAFYELSLRPVLRRFMLEMLLLSTGGLVVQTRQEKNEELCASLSNELAKELKPRFNKSNAIFSEHNVEITSEEQPNEGDELTHTDLLVTWDLAVFSEVLIKNVLFLYMETVTNRIKRLEQFYKVRFSAGYLMLKEDTDEPYRSTRNLVLLYPATSTPLPSKVRIEELDAKERSNHGAAMFEAMMRDLSRE